MTLSAATEKLSRRCSSSRYSTEIFSAIQNTFSKTETPIFENIYLQTNDAIHRYTRILSEDRKLWTSLFANAGEFEKVMQNIIR